jgi:primosomal protein N' (replication factor Y)
VLTRFRARFGETVAVLHSALSAAERRDEWERLRSGRARVCVGPRSAVFAPVADLGLLVVDEEHDPSYKQEGDPRYDARAVARRRAAEAGAALVLGSATPRPESWRELPRLELPERVDGRRLPEIELVDMRGRRGAAGPLHPRTRAALATLREEGGKAIVMLNRRGFSPYLACRECGHTLGCPSCDVSLVLHRAEARLACHHCGHSEPEPDSCPECGSLALARHGIGTERLESLLASELDPLPVFRLDSDAAAGRHAEILRRFGEAPGGALVGTQMVAKGHDFPDVTLSVLLDADATLRFPDFRAEERAFSQIAQLAGRSGRGEAGGRVIVQTLAPEAEAIRRAAAHDVAGFLEGELQRRRELRYPPFASLVRVEVSAPEAEAAERAAAALRARIEPELPGGAELLGPAPRLRTRARHRRQLLLKAPEPADSLAVAGERAPVGIREQVVAAVREAVGAAAARELRGCAVSVDVDPQ